MDTVEKTVDAYWVVNLPNVCPHCSTAMEPSVENCGFVDHINSDGKAEHYRIVLSRCTASKCKRYFITVHHLIAPDASNNRYMSCIFQYPSTAATVWDDLIKSCSPNFVRLYEEARTAELADHKQLAAAGYRIALEHLVKDYLVNEKGEPDENIKNAPLAKCIGDHFSFSNALMNTADVVRILGNDYVHYEQKHSNVSFEQLRFYLDIFVNRILEELRIAHPPVSRNGSHATSTSVSNPSTP